MAVLNRNNPLADTNPARRCTKQALDLMWRGRMAEGLQVLRDFLSDHPDDARIHTMLLFFSHYDVDVSRRELFRMHADWAARHAPLDRARTEHDRVPDPGRRLRIGYVSPDFYSHAVTFAFENLLAHRDRESFEIFGYGSVRCPDATTARLRRQFDHYRDVAALTDEALAERIERDRIDILVHIAGHVAGHRLGALAYKPAPVQIDFQGVDTTGLPSLSSLRGALAAQAGGEEARKRSGRPLLGVGRDLEALARRGSEGGGFADAC